MSLCSVHFVVSTLFLSFSAIAQSGNSFAHFTDMAFSDTVELRNSAGSKTLSAIQAKREIRSFIQLVQPSEIKTIHKGFSKDKVSYYGIVQLVTETGNHRVFYFCEHKNGQYIISKIRIHKR